jgi:hypothetical protein
MTTTAAPSLPRVAKPLLRRGRFWIAVLAWLLALGTFAAAVHYGIELRRWLWDQTTRIRFVNSVSNAIEWGRYANKVGVYQLYDKLLNEHGPEGEYKGPARFTLDYPPLRLVIAATWADWAERNFPPPKGQQITWKADYAFTEPMLRANMYCELAAAIAMFLLVREWVRQCAARPYCPIALWQVVRPRGSILQGLPLRRRLKFWWHEHAAARPDTRGAGATKGLLAGTIAALLVWFNPALIWNAQVYPQWDVWLLPPFILAVFFALRNWWLPAGLIIGGAAMAKGQILFVAPMLLAWPILRGYPWGAVRLAIGVVGGVALVVWPWLLASEVATNWMTRVLWGSVILLACFGLPRKGLAWKICRVGVAGLGAAYIAAPWLLPYAGEWRLLGVLFAVVLGVMAALLPWRWALEWAALAWAGGMLLVTPLCGASTAWLEVGLMYGTRHWKQLYWCQASNLGSILQERFGWRYRGENSTLDLAEYVPYIEPNVVPIRDVMTWAFVICLALCTVGLVLHHRRRDLGFFYALAAPWLLAYAILPQMIERYLMWPAVLFAAAAGVRVGGLLMYLVLSLGAWIMMVHYMLRLTPASTPERQEWFQVLQRTFPGMGWGVVLLAGVALYLSLRPSSRRVMAEPAAAPKQ